MNFIQELWENVGAEDRKLAKAFFALSLLVLAAGDFMGFLLTAAKVPLIRGFVAPYYNFYNVMTAHATLIFMYTLGLFEIVLLLAIGLGILNQKLVGNRVAWGAFGAILAGLVLQLSAFLLGADTTYKVEPITTGFRYFWLQHLGYLLLGGGSFTVFLLFVLTIFRRELEERDGTLNHLGFAMGVFALLGVFGNLTLMYVMGRGLMWDLGVIDMSTALWRHHFHLFFHMIHYIPLIAIMSLWYLHAYQWNAPSITGQRFIRGIWASYLFLVPPTFLYHLLASPELPAIQKTIGSMLSLLVATPTLLHVIIVLGMMEVLIKKTTNHDGLLGWMKALPWKSPGFASVLVSAFLMVSGAMASGPFINVKLSSMLTETFAVPAYFHPMAGAVTMVFMGMSYYLVTMFTKRRLWDLRLAQLQPYLYGGGLAIFGLTGTMAGFLGVPRRVADITFGGAAPVGWSVWMNVWGIGAFLALLGGFLFIFNMVMTALMGQEVEDLSDVFLGLEPTQQREEVGKGEIKGAYIPSIAVVILTVVLVVLGFRIMAGWPVGMR
jgi:cytochrome c oxidase subunit 1